jgi:CrcB protein
LILALGFAALAVTGTLARVATVARFNTAAFPFGTLVVNVVGSFLLALLSSRSPEAITALGVAGLGSFTTFSTFAHEGIVMAGERRGATAAAYLAITVIAGVGAAAVGLELSA